VAARVCFRSEVEANSRLFQGLTHEQVNRLRQDLAASVGGLRQDLRGRLSCWLTVVLADR
jgi:hypothetical protein